MLRPGLRPESNKTGTKRTMCAFKSGANSMDFRETERVETSDVATMELTKNDAPVAPESKGESVADAAPTAKLNDSSEAKVHARRFDVVTDKSRDALLTDFGKETLEDRYLLPGESYQDLFARVASAYADDQEHAQRLYDYISKLWFMPATPVLSNGGTGRGLPISCYLNSVPDSLEGIVETWNENVWLASRGGGIGTYWGSVRGIGEPVGLNGKTSGIIPFVRVMDSLTDLRVADVEIAGGRTAAEAALRDREGERVHRHRRTRRAQRQDQRHHPLRPRDRLAHPRDLARQPPRGFRGTPRSPGG